MTRAGLTLLLGMAVGCLGCVTAATAQVGDFHAQVEELIQRGVLADTGAPLARLVDGEFQPTGPVSAEDAAGLLVRSVESAVTEAQHRPQPPPPPPEPGPQGPPGPPGGLTQQQQAELDGLRIIVARQSEVIEALRRAYLTLWSRVYPDVEPEPIIEHGGEAGEQAQTQQPAPE